MAQRVAESQLDSCILHSQSCKTGTKEILHFLQKLKEYSRHSVKRCREKALGEALNLLRGSRTFWNAEEDSWLAVVRCVLLLQVEAASSPSCFQKLDRILVILAEGNEAAVVDEIRAHLTAVESRKDILVKDLQTVSAFMEESCFGHLVWKEKLHLLLETVANAFEHLLEGGQEDAGRNGEQCYLLVKLCLQTFQRLPEDVAVFVWSKAHGGESLQRILRHLVQVVMGSVTNKDSRLLAGVALAMLINTAPDPGGGATATLHLLQLGTPGLNSLVVGELQVPACACVLKEPDGMEKLTLCRGLVTSCRKEILIHGLKLEASHKCCVLLDVIFPVIYSLCEECHLNSQYLTLQAVSLWLKCVKDSLPNLWEEGVPRLLGDDSDLLHKLTKLIWSNAESPVEGVPELANSTFHLLLDINKLECQHFQDHCEHFYMSVLQRIIALPWQVKARYMPLATLLPYMGLEKVLAIYKDLPQHILNALSTNYLSPSVTEVYRTALQLQREACLLEMLPLSEDELASQWARHWLGTLTAALTSEDAFLQNNASNYLLVWTLRIFPSAFQLLVNQFSCGQHAELRATITLLSVRRMITGVLPYDTETLKMLRVCMHAQDESTRLAVIGLLCRSPKTNQALTDVELDLLKEILPLNMNSDSSSFRQLLHANMKKALVRLRDSCLLLLRQRKGRKTSIGSHQKICLVHPNDSLSAGVDFVEWMTKLVISSLAPGMNYQRKKTALLLLSAVLETCTDSWTPEKKKGQPPAHMVELVEYTRERGCWDFFSRTNLLTLLSCLQDGTNEIRELSAELLVKYFPGSFPEDLAVALWDQARKNICSPRVPEADAGALMMKTVLQKFDDCILRKVLAEGEHFHETPCMAVSFIAYLLRELQDQFNVARGDLLQAAGAKGLHGVLTSLRRCLIEAPEVAISMQKTELRNRWQEQLGYLVMLVQELSTFLLGILYGTQDTDSQQHEVAPSFAEMGNAIQNLIAQGKGLAQSDCEDSVLLSEEHSLILTCCWVSIKEIGVLMGTLVEKVLLLEPVESAPPLMVIEDLKTTATVFKDVMLKCRHWGAVEGCGAGFTKFCSLLLNHRDSVLRDIPRCMLEQALMLLKSVRNSSITRRAAGLPMLLLCILIGEDGNGFHPLLAQCIGMLLETAHSSLPEEWDQTLDLPQVSAVHILQTLVRSSELGMAVLQYAPALMILALKALTSPCWSMRNAAMQLFSALTARMLGQRRSKEDTSAQNGMSPQAFFSNYPELQDVLLKDLRLAASFGRVPKKGKFHLFPSLQSILALLAKLLPAASVDADSCFLEFLEILRLLAGSPVYAERVMASRALVPFVIPSQCYPLLLSLVTELPQEGDVFSHNALHGCLLQIHALLCRALQIKCLTSSEMKSVAQQLENSLWLAMSKQQCPLIGSAYLKILESLSTSFTRDFCQKLLNILRAELVCTVSRLKIGSAAFRQAAARLICMETARMAEESEFNDICQLLLMDDSDMRLAIVSWINEGSVPNSGTLATALRRTLMEVLPSVLGKENNIEFLKLYLDALVLLHGKHHQPFTTDLPESPALAVECANLLLHMVETDYRGPDLQSSILRVASILLVQSLTAQEQDLIKLWWQALQKYSTPESPEVLRLAVAHSLELAGVALVQKAHGETPTMDPTLAVRLVNIAIRLLQDEDQAVRLQTARFATLVQPQHQGSADNIMFVQSNWGLVCLLKLLVQDFWDCGETFEMLLQHLEDHTFCTALEEHRTDKNFSLYEQDEPNVFAEPAAFAKLLLLFLTKLVDTIAFYPRHHKAIECWVITHWASILHDLKTCQNCWMQGSDSLWKLKAVSSAKVRTAFTILWVKVQFLAHILDIWERGNRNVQLIDRTSQELKQEAKKACQLLAQHGVII
ncbi:thyroid adenoma-associated protein homolog [Protopterus annectens]|uniref:thyroid adenoma-associated protein homolog n=1 Tax=Protopterus annectens TaxID=7888 RepID=UPI001CFAFB97|nr:thyroid adenoma-associated protein homolog [Protopterus annectens]